MMKREQDAVMGKIRANIAKTRRGQGLTLGLADCELGSVDVMLLNSVFPASAFQICQYAR